VGIDVTQNQGAISLTFTGLGGAQCHFNGTITPFGKLSNIDGNYSCPNGISGMFAMRRLEGGIDGLTGSIVTLSNSGCNATVVTIGAARIN
jgi:hypothetical protein